MPDRYSQIVNAPVVSALAKQVGLPQPVDLDRYERGARVVSGPVL
jgi:3-oxoacyl-[acyl-carrier protein] reductase